MQLEEQERVLNNTSKNMLVSASAGSGKTYIMIKYICKLVCEEKIPLDNFLVLTFTKAAAAQMKDGLSAALKQQPQDDFITSQIDALATANICTIHSFCEKYLKKYANLLNLNENFDIVDENVAQKIKDSAFNSALKNFEQNSFDDFMTLYGAFKNDKRKIKDIILGIEMLSCAVADKDNFLQDNLSKSNEFFDSACDYLFDSTKRVLENCLKQVDFLHVEDFYVTLKTSLAGILNSKNLLEMSVACEEYAFPYLPKRKVVGDEIVDKLSQLKQHIVGQIGKIKQLNLQNTYEKQSTAVLENVLIKLYFEFENCQNQIKQTQNVLDFNDLEKYMTILSTKENLFSSLQFVFVDEYQDTNKIQERIIKNMAKNCNFVAVGDLKQGIYGFRLASSQIFMNDLKEFEADENSSVNYLHSNFRSSKKVLDFVNDIFKKIMTTSMCGVDYEKTSMLQGLSEFAEEDAKAVNIDLITPQEEEFDEIPKVYSVKEAKMTQSNSNKKILLDIKCRILEVMKSQISKDGVLRPVKFADIAILSRKRDTLYSQLEEYLQGSGIPVISNSRSLLLDEPEVKMLLNCLKVALGQADDVVLLSALVGLDYVKLDELSIFENGMKIVETDAKFAKFRDDFQDFRLDIQVFGIKHAFERLFLKTDYLSYIYSKPNHEKLKCFIDKFLESVSAYDFDLPMAISFIENVDINVEPEISVVEDSVLLTTIHNSKGLEYPIVFIIGCDQSLSKAGQHGELEINERFGLAVKYYDAQNNEELVTARMRAIADSEAEKDFIEEIMIFYVALTRAKNRLYLFGEYKENSFNKFTTDFCDSYFDFIFFALSKARDEVLLNGKFEDENLEIQVVGNVAEEKLEKVKEEKTEENSQKIQEKIENYLNFSYVFDDAANFRLKESVTSLNNKSKEEKLVKYNNENFKFTSNAVDVGNAYHAALKAIDFEKIESKAALCESLANLKDFVDVTLIDTDILFENITLLKNLTSGGRVFKEKEFLMKAKLCDIIDTDCKEEILVQGVVDLFVVKGEEIILVDYKYTNSDFDLVKRYVEQLKLYKIALENSLKLKINSVYLLSIKTKNLIKVEI